jgi:glycine/D-amino acid oxidase-like deaminating enzyme
MVRMPAPRRRITIVGAGPIGLECALYGARLGHEVTVLEAGEIAHSVRSWGHVRMFSPWEMNVSALGLETLAAGGGAGAAPPSAFPSGVCPTGREYRKRYLLPLAASEPLRGRVRTGVRVAAIGRDRLLKSEEIGTPLRAERPFRILVAEDPSRGGNAAAPAPERIHEADVVIDASGVFTCHRWMGNGGLPAPGERALEGRIEYGLPDVTGADAPRFAARRTLVVGSGYSAATTALALLELARRAPGTRIVWAVRGGAGSEGNVRGAYAPIPDDPLPERAALSARAAQAARGGDAALECLSGAHVEEVREAGAGLEVEIGIDLPSGGRARRRERFDRIVANVGYRPDRSLYEELQVHECYASQGPMKLAAALLGEGSADCLAQKSHGPDTLRNPEPGFFILGAKSYGRNPTFLIRLGLAQVREVFQILENDSALDLYAARAA